MQTTLFPESTTKAPPAPRTYTVKRYAVKVIREKDPAPERCQIACRKDVERFAQQYLSDTPLESVLIIALDTGNRVIGFTRTDGAPGQCAVYPSNVFRFLLNACAAAFIIVHNHPGGSMEPSHADWTLTGELRTAGRALGCPLLDHIIIADNNVQSMRDLPRWK